MEHVKREARGRLVLWLLAWGLSLALLVPFEAVDLALQQTPRCSLAWLPWLAVSGLPLAGEQRSWLVALGLALPSVALAAWVDARTGVQAPNVAGGALAGLALFALLGESAYRASRARLAWYAPAWAALVLGAPTLAASLEWVSQGGMEPGGVAWKLAQLSPLGAFASDIAPPGSAEAAFAKPALGLVLVLYSAVAFHARARRERAS